MNGLLHRVEPGRFDTRLLTCVNLHPRNIRIQSSARDRRTAMRSHLAKSQILDQKFEWHVLTRAAPTDLESA